MSRFLQLHLLTFYPPANLNRDDTGRPKTAVIGGATRLRLSSQSLKRAWRTSDAFKAALDGHRGERTQRLGEVIRDHLIARGTDAAKATRIARDIVPVFGKVKPEADKNPTRTEQLAFISAEEREAALAMAEQAAAGAKIEPNAASLLRQKDTAADIAMFGRMLADNPDYNREAAVQVAHAITTHKIAVEDDYYVAVDDLKTPDEDAGAGFLGEAGFAAGLFYLYICADIALLRRNLSDEGLAATALSALVRAAATVAPTGKQASFASRARAHYVLAEAGDQTPRTLAGAFLKPVVGNDVMAASVEQLRQLRAAMDAAYGPCADRRCEMLVGETGALDDILAFCRGV
ncbi:type I-E CRISPR-associated protein Cas7/Cse4/CasC [Limobrevibacterium gyesilva]|uniref:Type I-E CRISPR-associated protein Cas7/Cse4/CasC n=1 Tax=Limobrevibacterium gyesilva TaxID=2991712 RepID=A0AA41YNN5_9PROT|nr:type I-E CRISPR-associated protein Cas7/Cse4/CasC [Limobrevibacterium gyesilva]MCW3476874.1 type I-E CRISPR-associated protein Cas7/Cse4/CasC [Limobrevibacterium gyesilva]